MYFPLRIFLFFSLIFFFSLEHSLHFIVAVCSLFGFQFIGLISYIFFFLLFFCYFTSTVFHFFCYAGFYLLFFIFIITTISLSYRKKLHCYIVAFFRREAPLFYFFPRSWATFCYFTFHGRRYISNTPDETYNFLSLVFQRMKYFKNKT